MSNAEPIEEYAQGRRQELNEHKYRMNNTRLVKISRDKSLAERRSTIDRASDGVTLLRSMVNKQTDMSKR